MPTPEISVLMPVYNAERYVAEAVESILSQTFRDFEFLIIDDGSTDRSLEILRKYQKRDSRICLSSRANTGIVGALNEMLAIARGEFVARMDADDIAMPERFEVQFNAFEVRADMVALGTAVRFVDPGGRCLLEPAAKLGHTQIDDAILNGETHALVHPSLMCRTSALREIGGYDSSLAPAEDIDVYLRLAEVGQIANISRVLLHYRLHEQSVSVTKGAESAENQVRAREAAYRRRGLKLPRHSLKARPNGESSERARVWGWWALSGGHVATARRYALKSIRLKPASLASWKLLACAVRGR